MKKQDVLSVISRLFIIDKDNITHETKFDDLGIDSLDLYTLIMHFENEYNIDIEVSAVNDIYTIGNLFDVLRLKDVPEKYLKIGE
jgi:acyl carrier protein